MDAIDYLTFFTFITVSKCSLLVRFLIEQRTTFLTVNTASVVHAITFNDLKSKKMFLEKENQLGIWVFVYLHRHRCTVSLAVHAHCNRVAHRF